VQIEEVSKLKERGRMMDAYLRRAESPRKAGAIEARTAMRTPLQTIHGVSAYSALTLAVFATGSKSVMQERAGKPTGAHACVLGCASCT